MPDKFLTVRSNIFYFVLLDHGPEVVGCAMSIVAWLSLGQKQDTPDNRRRVCHLDPRKWRRLEASISAAVSTLIENSEPRVQMGRPSLSKARRTAIFERDGEECSYCKTKIGPFHIDHVKPLARGGSNRDDNLCVACAPCNFAKAANLFSEWNY